MPLESGTYISDLVATNPVGATDQKAEGDDHIRLLKATIKNTFPNVTGAVTGTHTQLNSAAAAFGASNVALLNAANTFSVSISVPAFTVTSTITLPAASVADAALSSNVPLLNAANTYTGNSTYTNTAPFRYLVETGVAADSGRWLEQVDGAQYGLYAVNDAATVFTPFLTVNRTGTTVDEIQLDATLLDINGNLDVDGETPDINGSSNLGLHGGGSDISLAASGITLDADGGGAIIFLDGGINQITITADVFFVNGAAVHFDDITTSASAANAFLDSTDDNRLYRSTSSIAYKKDIENLDSKDYAKILGLRPIRYHSKAVADDPSREFVGLIAEEVAEVDPRLVHFHKGKPDGVMYDRVTVGLIGIVREQQKAIDDLRREIDRLKH